MNVFPADFNGNLTGFGGDPGKDKTQHRAALQRTPVILVHGNAGNSMHPMWGYQQMTTFLKEIGYQDCEIWAMDYLGENNTSLDMPTPHTKNIDAFRTFVDRVKDYLGVDKMDFIAHSLGCGMVNGYLRGLQSDGRWDPADNRLDVASTFVSLAGATYGLGPFGQGEFMTGSAFEIQSHKTNGVVDDTPFGEDDTSEQIAPNTQWKKTTSLDNDGITYVAIIAINDFVDASHPNTGRREGAHLIKGFELGPSTIGHERIIKDPTVFNAVKDYLNQHPPGTRPVIQVDLENGNYPSGLQVTVTVEPPDVSIQYTARRIQKEFQNGAVQTVVAETDEGALSNGQSLALTTDGLWEVVLSAQGADDTLRLYGVNVIMPEVTILTDNQTPFQDSLKVMAATTRGTLYHSLDKQHWSIGAILTITSTATVYFIALDGDGLASPVVQRAFEKKPKYTDRATATLTGHFLAGRLSVYSYVDLGLMLGFNAVITLYLINDEWVYDPEAPEPAFESPIVDASVDSGIFNQPLSVTLTASDPVDAAPRIFYTLDGSEPNEYSNSFTSSGTLRFDAPGSKTLKYRARNAWGSWLDSVTKTYGMELKPVKPRLSADKPNGTYPEGFETTISVADPTDSGLPVYYTEDGSDPSDARNPNRAAFSGSQSFKISGNGNHAIRCYARNSGGHETQETFAWCVDDPHLPKTSISPSNGGLYVGYVEVQLSASEPCQWTKYTTDGTHPSDDNGITYEAPFTLERTTLVKFRSKDTQGNLEPVRTARFTITRKDRQVEFHSKVPLGGYVKADADGRNTYVSTCPHPAIGSGHDGKDHRAILHFDTSSLPDNARVRKAYLALTHFADSGDAWKEGRSITVDIQTGYLGTSQALQADDWNAAATAPNVASIEKFSSGGGRSSDFSQTGCDAINKTGVTQVRLRCDPPHATPNNHLFIRGEVRLAVEYSI